METAVDKDLTAALLARAGGIAAIGRLDHASALPDGTVGTTVVPAT